MKIERRRIEDLQLDPDNAREHDDANLEAIKSSLGKFGQRKPIVVADGVVIAGNGTMLAAQALGWKEIDTVSADDLDELERKAYAIADNRTAELAKWNQEKLAQALADITQIGDELGEASGFDHEAIVDLVSQELGDSGEPAEIVEDEVPEVEEETVTQPGDLWVLGEHRLLCGDSTKGEDVDRLFAGGTADATVTDPPYGISYRSNHRKERFDELQNDDRILGGWVEPSMRRSRGWIVFFCAWQRLDEWMEVGRQIGNLTNLLIWKKAAAMGDLTGSFAPTFEVALAYNRGEKLLCHGRPSAVLEHRIDAGITFQHPTTKPVGLLADILQATTRNSVFDPFLGSGTTLIAAEQLGRKCYGLELDPRYCDVIVRRWQKLTGQRPVNEATGELFPE